MAKVTGLGGVFYVVKDPAATRAWYRDVLGLDGEYGPQLNWSEAVSYTHLTLPTTPYV